MSDTLERFKRTVRVVLQEQYDGGPFDFGESYEDGSLNRVIDSLLAIRESIPAEHRASARCQIDSVGSYEGSHYARIEVNYARPETDEEWAERRTRDISEAQAERQREMAEYERLKAKFES